MDSFFRSLPCALVILRFLFFSPVLSGASCCRKNVRSPLKVKGATSALKHDAFKRLPSAAKRWAPTAVGLGIIPFIVAPIDEGVTWTMDQTFRKWLKNVGTPGDTSEGPK